MILLSERTVDYHWLGWTDSRLTTTGCVTHRLFSNLSFTFRVVMRFMFIHLPPPSFLPYCSVCSVWSTFVKCVFVCVNVKITMPQSLWNNRQRHEDPSLPLPYFVGSTVSLHEKKKKNRTPTPSELKTKICDAWFPHSLCPTCSTKYTRQGTLKTLKCLDVR